MAIIFTPENHKYKSKEPDGIEWISVTSFISNFKQPFDADAIAAKSSRSKKSKWYGMTPEAIKDAWKAEANRATTLGTWYHNCREKDLCEINNIERQGVVIPVIKPIELMVSNILQIKNYKTESILNTWCILSQPAFVVNLI